MIEKKDILYSIYLSKEKVGVFDLLYEFGITYKELKGILDEFVEKDMLMTEDGRSYIFTGDGRIFSGKFRRNKINRYMSNLMEWAESDMKWMENDDADSKFKTRYVHDRNFRNSREEFLRRRRAYFESRRKEALMDMENDMEEESDEDNSPKDPIHEAVKELMREVQENMEDDNDSDGDLSDSILENIKNCFEVEGGEDKNYLISVSGLDFCGTDVRFELFTHGGKVYLSDQKATFCALKEKGKLNHEAREKAERIAAESEVELVKERLCIQVPSAPQTILCLFRLYAAMERVYHV